MKNYISHSEDETKKIAEDLAKHSAANIFALTGELGAGKTIFVQGFARGLGITEKIISPTFVLIRQHKIPKSRRTLYHMDLYRLDRVGDFKQLGLSEILSDPSSIALIEWAEKAKKILPKNAVKVFIEKTSEDQRLVTIE